MCCNDQIAREKDEAAYGDRLARWQERASANPTEREKEIEQPRAPALD
jgi:hypothetical protein